MAAAPPGAAGTPQEPAVTIDLTTTQYVILAENQRKKRALVETKERCNALAAENAALLRQLEDQQREGYAVTEHFRAELVDRNGRIAQLQADLEALQADKDAHVARLQEQAAAREAQLLRESEAAAQELYARIDALQGDLDAVADYREKQVEFEATVAALREESQGLREALSAQKTELERYYAGQNAKMRKEYEQRLEELKHAQDEELEERLDASVKRILAHNRRMAEELRLHVQESDVLQAEVRLLETERQRLLRELALKAELEEGYAKRGAAQGAALKQAQARVGALEAGMAQLLQDMQTERAATMQRAQAQVSDARRDAEALRRLLRLKTREIKTLRRLGQEALLQRSEVEIFMIAALHQAREEIAKEREGAITQQRADAAIVGSGAATGSSAAGEGSTAADGAATARDTTGVGSNGAAGDEAGSAAAAAPVDIRDLTWEQRERVLRLLFARITAHAAPLGGSLSGGGGGGNGGGT